MFHPPFLMVFWWNSLSQTQPFDFDEWIAPFLPGAEPNMGGLGKAHFGHLPVWVDGNAYFNGCNIYAKEKHCLENKTAKVKVQLVEKDGKYSIKTNLYTYLKNFTDGIIATESLGKAFEPEQRFENPDGTDIIFNQDYFGAPRGIDTIPGPFASAVSTGDILW